MSVTGNITSLKRTRLPLQTSLMHNLINIIRRNPRHRRRSRNIQHLSRQPTNFPHTLLLLLIQNLNLRAALKRLLAMRYAIFPIIRVGYRFRYVAAGREGVDGAQGTGVGEGREGVVVSGGWIGFRDYFWGNEITEEITLGFVDCFVCAL